MKMGMELYFQAAGPQHQKREKAKARELRQTTWWRQQLGKRRCYYCEGEFSPKELTMDHLMPIARGGMTSKKNVVVSCKTCNSEKKYHLPVELEMQRISQTSEEN